MTKISISQLQSSTGVGFGTSGIRDLVVNLNSRVVYSYTTAFLNYARIKGNFTQHQQVALAGDLRQSTPDISEIVAQAILDQGLEVINYGYIPTPALISYALSKHIPSIMVTGSHIPSDRNGIKFNLAQGEILKADEAAINDLTVDVDENRLSITAKLPPFDTSARQYYIDRFLNFFPNQLLSGKKIGVYGHTAVGRDIYVEILEKLGAQVVKLEYSDVFVPVDTEIVNPELISKTKSWMQNYALDHVISADGDGDRPLLTDESGNYLRNDVIPIIAAKYLNADAVACTINCNTSVLTSGFFKKIELTKIGSPTVISGMNKLVDEGYTNVVGYEGNGGFLTAQNINKNGRTLSALPTRDAILPILCVLATTKELISSLPRRSTYFSSIKGIPTAQSLSVIDNFDLHRPDIESIFGKIISINLLDGLRLTFENGNIVHFRPSRNSPEFRDYVEADTFEAAQSLSDQAQELIKKWTTNPTN